MADHANPGTQLDGADGEHEHRGLKDRVEHPFPELREKLKHTNLYDLKAYVVL
jgi:phospholipase D1/2